MSFVISFEKKNNIKNLRQIENGIQYEKILGSMKDDEPSRSAVCTPIEQW